MTELDLREVVLGRFASAGLAPAAEELDGFVQTHAGSADDLAAMWSLPQARYEVPALRFQADPRFVDWSASGPDGPATPTAR